MLGNRDRGIGVGPTIAGVVAAVVLLLPTTVGASGTVKIVYAKSPATIGCSYARLLFAASDETQIATATSLAAPNSPAMSFAQYVIAVRRALRAEDLDVVDKVTCNAKVVTDKTSDPTQSPTRFTAFKLDRDGLLVSFKEDGKRLSGRVVGGSGQSATVLGVTLTLAGAHVNSSGQLIVVLDATDAPDRNSTVLPYDAIYVSPSGKSRPAASKFGDVVGAHAVATLAIVFASGPIGGTVTVPVGRLTGSETESAVFSVK
jgi:hypothetical protein